MRRIFGIFLKALLFGVLLVGCGNDIPSASTAVPTITPFDTDGEACQGKIQATTPEIVRPEGMGGIDTTEYGRYATNPKAASTSAGILVTWQTGIDGQYPVPNSYVRLMDDDGKPLGEMTSLMERSVVQTSHFVSKGDGALLTFCGVYADNTHITSTLLDSHGTPVSEQRRFASDRFGCGDPEADAIWTGSRLLFAWSAQPYEPDNDILLEIADAKGNSLIEKKFLPNRNSDPHFAFGHGRLLMVLSTRTGSAFINGNNRGVTHLVVNRFDTEGNELGKPVTLEPLGGWEFGNTFVVPTKDGWLVLASTYLSSPNYYFAHLAPDGSLVSGPELVNTGTEIAFVDAVSYAGGVAVLVGHQDGFSFSKVWFLSADGYVHQEWLPGSHEYMGMGGLVVHKGRLFVTYATPPRGKPVTNQVLLREFQCIP
jgi:hypothetical protein